MEVKIVSKYSRKGPSTSAPRSFLTLLRFLKPFPLAHTEFQTIVVLKLLDPSVRALECNYFQEQRQQEVLALSVEPTAEFIYH